MKPFDKIEGIVDFIISLSPHNRQRGVEALTTFINDNFVERGEAEIKVKRFLDHLQENPDMAYMSGVNKIAHNDLAQHIENIYNLLKPNQVEK